MDIDMDSEKLVLTTHQRIETLHELELVHQKARHQTDLVIQDEEARRLCLGRLLAEDETAKVRDALSHASAQLDALTMAHATTRSQLRSTAEAHAAASSTTRAQARKLANLQAELDSLSSSAAQLRPQLEHARSQLTGLESTLADKLTLQRSVDALEVALADERRAARRASDARAEAEDALEAEKKMARKVCSQRDSLAERVRELDKDLADAKAAGREARKKAEVEAGELRARLAEADKTALGQRSQRDSLAKRVQELEGSLAEAEKRALVEAKAASHAGARLRDLQDELTKCRTELGRAKSAGAKKPAPANKKRRANDDDDALQTPGRANDDNKPVRRGPKARSGVVDASHVGEKSTFSITPFLNRTLTLTGDATVTGPLPMFQFGAEEEEQEELEEEARCAAEPEPQPEPEPEPEPAAKKSKARSKPHKASTTVLGPCEPNKQNLVPVPVVTAGPRKPPARVRLAQVVEEADEMAEMQPQPPKAKKRKLTSGTSVDEAEPGKTKKKLSAAVLGRLGPGPAVVLGPGKGKAKAKVVAFAGPGGFSPLKRDRRGANASFLA